MRHPPAIGTNTTWECGQCAVGFFCEKVFSCRNTGGQCNYKVEAQARHPGGGDSGDAADKPVDEHCTSPGAFSISPRAGFIGAGGKWEFSVQFRPNQTGPQVEEFNIVCDEGTVSFHLIHDCRCFKFLLYLYIKIAIRTWPFKVWN